MSISPISSFSAATTEMVAISAPPTGTAHDLYFYRSLRVIDLTNVDDDKVEDDVCHIKTEDETPTDTEYDYDTKYYNL